MKFREYGKEEEEKIVRIRVDIREEELVIQTVDHIGISVSILAVLNKEGIILCKRINPRLGFDLDEEGRLKVL